MNNPEAQWVLLEEDGPMADKGEQARSGDGHLHLQRPKQATGVFCQLGRLLQISDFWQTREKKKLIWGELQSGEPSAWAVVVTS